MPVTVSFKTLTQITFTLDLDENETIADVKTKVAVGRGDEYAADLQKLIYNGKILDDAQKVSEVGFETTKFVVVMLSRRKVEAAPAAVPSPAPVVAAPVPAPAPVAAAPAAAPVAAPAADNFTAEQESSIEAVAGMGYPRDQVIAALRAAYWNPDRAVEFLLSGIPELAADDAAVMPQDDALINEDDDQEGPGDLLALRDMPQLDEMRELVRENPEMLGAILQQLAAVNPELVQAIQGNQQAFIDLLNAPVGSDTSGGGQPGAPRNRAPRQHVIQLSPDELAAINRIKSMGFQVSEQAIVEAYFACDKNEEAAIEFILSTMEDQ